MALNQENTADFVSYRGVPDDNTVYQTLDFGFKSIMVKIIVTAGILDVSVNKSDATPHMLLPVGQYDFPGLALNKLHVRNTSATAHVIAWTD